MPELPEVETTIRGLKPIVGSTILNIKIHTPKLRFFIPKNILSMKQFKIINIKRRAKYIFIILENNYSIVIHLGMSGKLRLITVIEFKKAKHDHFILRTNKDHFLVFNDTRRFGFVDCEKTKIIQKRKYIMNLGKEALSRSLNDKYLFSKII